MGLQHGLSIFLITYNMNELFYFPAIRINAKIAEIIDEGHHLMINDYRYERLLRRPKGRSILRKLVNETENTRIIIYK